MSSGMIRKYMDLLGGAVKPVQLNENEMVDEAKNRESWVGRRVADRFAAEGEQDGVPLSPMLWWLGTITKDDGDNVTVAYDNTSFNDPNEYTLTIKKMFYTGNNPLKRGQVVLKDGVPHNANGLTDSDIQPLMQVDAPSQVSQPVVADKVAAPSVGGIAGGTFKLTSGMLAALADYAEDGDRIQIDGKTIYAGFGNRSGLHSYLSTALANTFAKWPRAKAKLEAGAYNTIDVLTFRNIDRDRGRWIKIKSYTSATVEAVQEDMAAVNSFRVEGEVRDAVYAKSGKTRGQGYPNRATQMLADFKARYPEGHIQHDSVALPGQVTTALWDTEGYGAKLVGIWVPSSKYGFLV